MSENDFVNYMNKLQNKNLDCPICRNKLPIEKWNKKLDYEDTRKSSAKLIIRENQSSIDLNKENTDIIFSLVDQLLASFGPKLNLNTIYFLLFFI